MTTMLMIFTLFAISNINPIMMAILVLAISLSMSLMLFKLTMTSWMTLITIIIFSSGMMILFNYAASLSPNEINTMKKKSSLMLLMFLTASFPIYNSGKTFKSMKTFSMNLNLMLMTVILLMALLAISNFSHNPYQTMSSSF